MPVKTLVLGASLKPDKYSYKAIERLRSHGFEVEAVGLRSGKVADVQVLQGTPDLKMIDTVTLYLNPDRQKELYSYIIGLHPRRIIFNPGTENQELSILAATQGIETVDACTLVMLATGQYS